MDVDILGLELFIAQKLSDRRIANLRSTQSHFGRWQEDHPRLLWVPSYTHNL